MMNYLLRIPACFILMLVTNMSIGDDVYLKNGGVLSGKIIRRGEKILLEQAGGIVVLDSSNVVSIEERSTVLHEFDERMAALQMNPSANAAEYTELGNFALRNKLTSRSIEAFKKAIVADPGYGDAGRALGYTYINGKWLSAEESARVQGLVRYNDLWVSNETREHLIRLNAQASADHSRAELESKRHEAIRNELALAEAQRAKAAADRDRAQALQHRRRFHHYSHHH